MRPLLALAFCLGAAPAQEAWTRILPPASPPWRSAHDLVHDAARGVCVLFGGWRSATNEHFQDTWEWDGATWTERVLDPRPHPRREHGLAYDAARGVVVLFGGWTPGDRFASTWEYDGRAWRLAHTLPGNESRYAHAQAYDAARRRVLRFGGVGGGSVQGDTWSWDGVAWTRLDAAGPPARRDARMAYDSVRDRMVLFGGNGAFGPLQDTWEFDGAQWLQRHPAARPTCTSHYALAFDAAVARVVLFGGTGGDNRQTWSWDGSDWTLRAIATPPPGRSWSAMAYDARRDRVVLFSGAQVDDADTWEYFAPVRAPAAFATFGTGCAGSAGVPRLAAGPGELPYIGAPFRLEVAPLPAGPFHPAFGFLGASRSAWGTLPLPLDLAPLGMPGCTLLASVDVSAALAKDGARARMTIGLPADRALVGRSFFTQACVLDAGANPGGLAWTDAGEARIGER
jgi:hypothetical protein